MPRATLYRIDPQTGRVQDVSLVDIAVETDSAVAASADRTTRVVHDGGQGYRRFQEFLRPTGEA